MNQFAQQARVHQIHILVHVYLVACGGGFHCPLVSIGNRRRPNDSNFFHGIPQRDLEHVNILETDCVLRLVIDARDEGNGAGV